MKTNDGSLDYVMERRESAVLRGSQKSLTPSDRVELGRFGVLEGLLVSDTDPAGLGKKLSDKSGFFGMEAHTEMPIETTAIALASLLFRKYNILIVDSFQLLNGTEGKKLSQAIKTTKEKLQMLAETFGLEFNFSLCSEFFGTKRYSELRRETEATILKSEELMELAKKTVPDGRDKNDLSFVINEVTTTLYMQVFKGADVKVGQQREKLYDAVTKRLEGSLCFAYMPPFFNLGAKAAEEVTPYAPRSGTKSGGKRILFDEIDGRIPETLKAVAEKLESGLPQAQAGLYRLAIAAASSGGACIKPTFECDRGFMPYNSKRLVNAVFRHIIRPYEMNRTTRGIDNFLNNI